MGNRAVNTILAQLHGCGIRELARASTAMNVGAHRGKGRYVTRWRVGRSVAVWHSRGSRGLHFSATSSVHLRPKGGSVLRAGGVAYERGRERVANRRREHRFVPPSRAYGKWRGGRAAPREGSPARVALGPVTTRERRRRRRSEADGTRRSPRAPSLTPRSRPFVRGTERERVIEKGTE